MTDQYEDWQTFNGPGECPVAEGVCGQAQTASETRISAEGRPRCLLSAWEWNRGLDHRHRIIAYRVLKEPKLFEPDWPTARLYAACLGVTCRPGSSETPAAISHLKRIADALGCDIVERDA